MPTSPLVSVVIPTRNRPDLLRAALASIAAQGLRADVEAIVVNDGGASVAPVVREWHPALAVKLVELPTRIGPAGARNTGIDRAEGAYLAFLDDDLFLPGHLAAGCEPLGRDDADFVYLGAVVADRRLTGMPQDLAGFPLKAYPYNHSVLQVANFLHTGSVLTRNFRHTAARFDESLDV